jgi:hypothetical protein
MHIILGFGKTEEDFEEQERRFVEGFLIERMAGNKDAIFSDEIVEDLRKALKERADEYRRLDREYHDATEYPDRYSTYYFTVLSDVCDLVVIFKFSHINRRHAMSPDGWALFGTKRVFHFYYDDMREAQVGGGGTNAK